MIKLDLYYANVVDNNDEDKLGRLQVRILPDFKDIKDALLPWAKPFVSSGFSATNYSMTLPEIGSNVWILADEDFRYFRYLFGSYSEGLFDYEAIETALGDVTEMSDKEYPNVDFDLSNDGSIAFHNRVSGDHGYLHYTGTYYVIDTDGHFYVTHNDGLKITKDANLFSIVDKDANTVTLDTNGMKLEDKNGNVIEMGTTSVKINGNLEVLQTPADP